MESAACSGDLAAEKEHFDCLTDAYSCLIIGSHPSQSTADVARVIFSGVCALVHGMYTMELTCISLTVVEKMISSLTSQSQPPHVKLYCMEILTMLFQEKDLISQLVTHFQAKDQIISYLAAKSVSTSVFYHLCKSGTLSSVWQQKCVQAFHTSTPGTELDTCLWSVTEVIKRILKGAHQEILRKILEAFDPSLCTLCSKFLPERKKVLTDSMDFTRCRQWRTTFCLLLDLLEVLSASCFIYGADVHPKNQRLTYLHSSALLTISSTSEYFITKRVLLLLKRAVLQKAGEEWTSEVLSTCLTHDHFSSDLSMLAQTVLTAADANWFQSFQVESASFFGGTKHVRRGEGQKPDSVSLRAVTLLILKSMELHIQTACATAGVESASEVYVRLQCLWSFLNRCTGQMPEITHLCCWVSLVFGEQDDDMMEAAKALMCIFLHHRLYSGLDGFALFETACAAGCNPHCHFLLLLQGVSFDHSILLDFLISAETCFLEYFVRYLKYLIIDWQGFTEACGRISMSNPYLSLHNTLTCSRHGDVSAQACKVQSPVENISLATGHRLVEYDNSDESENEDMEISEVEPGQPLCEKGRFSVLDVKQEISQPQISITQKRYGSCDSTELLSKRNSATDRLLVLQSLQTSRTNTVTLSRQMTGEISARTVLCLSELRTVVTKLHTKKIFPYNPSSLLKLLAQLEICFQ